MEGRVFLCSWKRVGARYRLWVKAKPRIAAEGETFADAQQALYHAILTATGDGENMHEFDPPPPSESGMAIGIRDQVVFVNGESWAMVANPEEVYPDGFCALCARPRGPRSAAPAILEGVESGVDGGQARLIRRPLGAGSTLPFFSDGFVSLLSPAERKRFTWRRTIRRGRARKQFLELISSTVVAPAVALKKGVDEHPLYSGFGRTLWQCGECGATNEPFYPFIDGTPCWYASAADVRGTCFLFGEPPHQRLSFTRARWRKLMGQKSTRAIKSYAVGALDPSAADLTPERVPLSEKLW